MSEWHRKPFLPCREYYPVGNRHLSAIVQVDDSGPGAPLAIVFQDPDLFGGGLGMKGDAFMFDPQRGLDVTALTVHVDRRPFRAVHTNLSVSWEPDGTPLVRAVWWAGPLKVREEIFPSVYAPCVYRRVTVENPGHFPCDLVVEAAFAPNPRWFSRVETGEGAAASSSNFGRFGLVVAADSRAAATVEHTGENEASVRAARGDLEPNSAWSATFAYVLSPDAAGFERVAEAFDEARAGADEAALRKRRRLGAVIECEDPDCRHVFDSAYRGISMAVSDNGRLNVGMWEYNAEWVRDNSQVALGALAAGLHEEAALILRHVVDDLVDDQGRTLIGGLFVESRYEQFDQAGLLLFALSRYRLWTGDDGLIREFLPKIESIAGRLLSTPCRDPETGLYHNAREFWERNDVYGFEEGYELAYQMWPALGLASTAEFRDLAGERLAAKIDEWVKCGEKTWRNALSHPRFALVDGDRLVKRRKMDGSIHRVLVPSDRWKAHPDIPLGHDRVSLVEPDTSCAVPITYGLVDPESPLAGNTVDAMEQLWNLRWEIGGYDRYHTSCEPHTVGPWTFASMFVARANHACGNIDRSLRTIRWLARTHGGRGGAWYEYIPITRENLAGNGLKPGIILWGWAEMAMFFTHQVLGVEPGRTGVTVAPRPFPAMGRVRASLPVRGRTLELELDAADPASGRARLDGGAWTPLGPKGVHLPYA